MIIVSEAWSDCIVHYSFIKGIWGSKAQQALCDIEHNFIRLKFEDALIDSTKSEGTEMTQI